MTKSEERNRKEECEMSRMSETSARSDAREYGMIRSIIQREIGASQVL
tara:strand:- start:366 stop:509 length:144 start_codon:yes stop_codon:yes gene_type:complete